MSPKDAKKLAKHIRKQVKKEEHGEPMSFASFLNLLDTIPEEGENTSETLTAMQEEEAKELAEQD